METPTTSVFDALNKKSFDELTPAQQHEVRAQLTQHDYELFHQIETLLGATQTPDFKHLEQNKVRLLQQLSPSQKNSLWLVPIALWKVAAILLLLGFGWLLHWQQQKQMQTPSTIKIDTVYLEKQVPVKIYDTVYIHKTSLQQHDAKNTLLHHLLTSPTIIADETAVSFKPSRMMLRNDEWVFA